jgi:hypothetical protein
LDALRHQRQREQWHHCGHPVKCRAAAWHG